MLEPQADHLERVLALLETLGTGGNLVTDAQIAVLALGAKACLHTADADFLRVAELQWLADIGASFRVPAGGGRPTDPRWTERRLVPLAPRTLQRLEALTARVREQNGVNVGPMQLAALLLEKTTEDLSEDEAHNLVGSRRRAGR